MLRPHLHHEHLGATGERRVRATVRRMFHLICHGVFELLEGNLSGIGLRRNVILRHPERAQQRVGVAMNIGNGHNVAEAALRVDFSTRKIVTRRSWTKLIRICGC